MHDVTPADDSIGERIAHYRRRRGLTQEVLAGQVGRSKSWLTKIERGELVMDRITTLLLLANVQKVEPGRLIGRIELPPTGGGALDLPRGIPAIRPALVVDARAAVAQDVPDARGRLTRVYDLVYSLACTGR